MLIGLSSCKTVAIPNFNSQSKPQIPNYNKESSWAVLPTNYPEKLLDKEIEASNLLADVFYIYPTLNIENKDVRWNVPVNDVDQNEKVINAAIKFQASAFINAGKLYVPYYRQAHLRSYSNLENGGESALNLAYSDVKRAFAFYLEKYNNGRPIIIAAHSQGTTHAIRLLKDFFDNKELQSKLIAAYLPGISIDKNEFETICLMTEPSETGGFVSWNTFKKNYYPKDYAKWFKGNAVSNPITWDNELTSNRMDHKGFLYANNTIYKKALEVVVKDGILWTSLPHFPFRIFLIGKKSYHVGDINLFWEDININAVLRVESYFREK
tara:strand:- start:2548 stop:3519 length:972 start_codon:yes stop_codon:yes gene_type:complete